MYLMLDYLYGAFWGVVFLVTN